MPKLQSDYDFNHFQLKNAVIHKGTADPGSPAEGQLFYRSDLDALRLYTNAWGSVGSSAANDARLFSARLGSGTLADGDPVSITGWNATSNTFMVEKADADNNRPAHGFVNAAVADTTTTFTFYDRYAAFTSGLNTSGATVGDPVYLSDTAGTFTLTAPTSTTAIVQIVGRVRTLYAALGVLELFPEGLNGKIGTNQHIALSITAALLAADSVTTAKVAKDNARRFTVYTVAGFTIDDLLHISGWNVANSCFVVELADADAGKPAHLIANATTGATSAGEARDLKLSAADKATTGATVGDPVYLDSTAGGWTLTALTGNTAISQIVGRVIVVNAAVGQIEFFTGAAFTKIGTNQLQDSSVTNLKLAGSITFDKLLSDVGTANSNSLIQSVILPAAAAADVGGTYDGRYVSTVTHNMGATKLAGATVWDYTTTDDQKVDMDVFIVDLNTVKCVADSAIPATTFRVDLVAAGA